MTLKFGPEAYIENLKKRLADSEAGAVAMKEALKRLTPFPCRQTVVQLSKEQLAKVWAALDGSAGKELLERVGKLERKLVWALDNVNQWRLVGPAIEPLVYECRFCGAPSEEKCRLTCVYRGAQEALK